MLTIKKMITNIEAQENLRHSYKNIVYFQTLKFYLNPFNRNPVQIFKKGKCCDINSLLLKKYKFAGKSASL